MLKADKDLPIIGSTEIIEVAGIKNIPAKVDTGADSSSIWASNIKVSVDGVLSFCLFDKSCPFYTGEVIKRHEFKAVLIRSSSGHEQIRYRTHLPLIVKGRRIKAMFTLSERSKNIFPVLIGRRTINGKFLVDVSKRQSEKPKQRKAKHIQEYFKKDPYKFHCEYIEKQTNIINDAK